MKTFYLALLLLSFSVNICAQRSEQASARIPQDVTRKFEQDAQGLVQGMQEQVQQGISELHRSLEQIQVSPDGQIVTSAGAVDLIRPIVALNNGLESMAKSLDIDASELAPLRDALNGMPAMLGQGLEMLKQLSGVVTVPPKPAPNLGK